MHYVCARYELKSYGRIKNIRVNISKYLLDSALYFLKR